MGSENENTNLTGAFDSHHPPALDLLEKCVHCGFCLPACPTYTLWGQEMDSPRGRIYLMKLALEGKAEMNEKWSVTLIAASAAWPACRRALRESTTEN